MKSTIQIFLAAVAALSFTSCVSTGTTSGGGAKPYTKDTCIVTDNKLGSMGDPVTIYHEGQEIKLCCSPCVAKFEANPDKFLAKL